MSESNIFSGITSASVTSVLSLFKSGINLVEFVVVPLLNCPLALYPVTYTFSSDVITAELFPPVVTYFIFAFVSMLISVNFV